MKVNLNLFLWGTGKIAKQIITSCQNIKEYNILGFIDNDESKWGSKFYNYFIYPPSVLHKKQIDKIVVLTNYYEDIKEQISMFFPNLTTKIENKNFFYKESILARYKECHDDEIIELLNYIKKNDLSVFNYSFAKKYQDYPVDIHYDEKNKIFYVIHNGKRMYMARHLDTQQSVACYYRSIIMEQDPLSPHKYLSQKFTIRKNDVVIDAGSAEGFFALDAIDRVSKIYIIENDEKWIEALKLTFSEYYEKVSFISKYITSYDEGKLAKLDSLINEPIDFIKMDIEGAEWEALCGAERIIQESPNIRIAICAYHRDFDQVLIESFLKSQELSFSTSPGYMWYQSLPKASTFSNRFVRGIIRAEKIKNI